jgi:uncharacterized protein YfaT (DUF1175 family)
MKRPRAGVIAFSTTAAVVLGLLWAGPSLRDQAPPRLTLSPAELPADGYAVAVLTIETGSEQAPRVGFTDNPHTATVAQVIRIPNGWQAKLRAGVWPARTTVRVEIPGAAPAVAFLTTKLAPGDSAGDGTPDFLRLDDRDESSFRRWFTFLAEAQYFQQPPARPAEIVDCAALIRYAYREALRAHTGNWAAEARLPLVQPFESVQRYQYPFTPLGSTLFRVREGSFRPSDLDDGAFGQFADAQTIQRLNTHFVSRDVTRALPGDLLFYRQDSGDMRFHSMIYVGASAIARDGARYVVYHTGPDGADPGEIRRLSLPELLRFPEPQWRPVGVNRNFLGVFRWNILREAS